DLAGLSVECSQSAIVIAADMRDEEPVIDHRGHSGSEERRGLSELLRKVLAPDHLPRCGVKTGEDAADAERVHPAIREDRSRFRPFAVRLRRRIHLVRRRVGLAPKYFT